MKILALIMIQLVKYNLPSIQFIAYAGTKTEKLRILRRNTRMKSKFTNKS